MLIIKVLQILQRTSDSQILIFFLHICSCYFCEGHHAILQHLWLTKILFWDLAVWSSKQVMQKKQLILDKKYPILFTVTKKLPINIAPTKSDKTTKFRGKWISWLPNKCIEVRPHVWKALKAEVSMQLFCPLLHTHPLTQKVHISLASAPMTHNLAEGGHKQKEDGSGTGMLREWEG